MVSNTIISFFPPTVTSGIFYQLSSILVLGVVLLLIWRIYSFTVLPLLYPHEPKDLPYWMPVFGHLVAFFRNPTALQDYAKKYFNNTQEPFTITLPGTKLYILTNPKDISDAYKNSSTLSFDIFVQVLIRTCGSSKSVVKRLYQDPAPSIDNQKSLGQAIHAFHIQQSSRGHNLESLSATFQGYFEQSLSLKDANMDSPYRLHVPGKGSTLSYSLKKWCAEVVINASQKAYFDDCLFGIDPDLAQTFVEFDTRSWQLLYGYPRFMSKKMHNAKDRIVDALTLYFETPAEHRSQAAWVTKTLEMESRKLGFSAKEMATLMLLQYWGINTNMHKACFWMLSYLLYDPQLLETIRAETALAFVNGSLNIRYLEESCPRLNGLWLEVLRLTVSSSSVRHITEDTTIGSKVFRSGNLLVNSCRQLHFNESIFGSNVSRFDSRRFVDRSNLHRSPSWKPFGGGVSMCPGRIIARRVAKMFVALVLHKFDLELAFTQPFPREERDKPDLGVALSKDDVVVSIKPILPAEK